MHNKVPKMWHDLAHAHISGLLLLTAVDDGDLLGYSKIPQVEEAIAAHLCPSTSLKVKSAVVLPNKPCCTTASITWKVYAVLGQAVSGLHSIARNPAGFPSKMLKHLDKDGPDPEIFRELRSTTSLVL